MPRKEELVVLQAPIRILRWLQLWHQPGEDAHDIRPKIRTAIALPLFSLTAFGSVLRYVYLLQHPEYTNIMEIMEDGINVVVHIIIYYSIYTVVSHRSEIEEFIWDLNDFSEFGQPPTIQAVNKYCNWFCYFFYGYCSCAMFSGSLLDIIRRKECLVEDVHQTRVCGFLIPVRFLIPIEDLHSFIIYWWVHVLSLLHFFNSGSVTMAFVYANVEVFTAKIAHLKDELTKLADHPPNFRERLKFCVDYHVKVIKMCENLNRIWGRLMLFHQILVSIILSLLGIMFLLKPELKFAVYAGGWLISLAIPCYAGQRLVNESCDIPLAAYSACWYNLDARDQRNFVFMVMRANEYLELGRDGYGPMNLSIVGQVVNNIYSLLTLIYGSMQETAEKS